MSDFGDLLLADAELAHILEQMLRILCEAGVRAKKPPVRGGVMTSSGAAELVREIAGHPEHFPTAAGDWAGRVSTAADMRNAMVHAQAADWCVECGKSTQYFDAKKSLGVDRSRSRIGDITVQLMELAREGKAVGQGLVSRLNKKLVDEARHEAAETQQSVSPPQFSFTQTIHRCADCCGAERGETVVTIGAAVVVSPPQTKAEPKHD